MVKLVPSGEDVKAVFGITGGLLVGRAVSKLADSTLEGKKVPVINIDASPVVKIVGGTIVSTAGMSVGGSLSQALTLAGAEMVVDGIVNLVEGFIKPHKAEYTVTAPIEITVTPPEEEKTVAPAPEIYNVY